MKKALIYITAIILFVELLDTTLLYACFVPIAKDFGINAARMSLPVLSYIVGTCIFIPTVAWLSHQFNKINIIIISLIGFSLCSVLCSISPGLYTFSIFRFFQGITISIAGAMSIIVLLSICSGKEIIKTMGVINIPALFGTAIGPFVGAVFSFYLSWRIAFFINFPVCIVIVLYLSRWKLDPVFQSTTNISEPKFDRLGFLLVSLSLILISIGLEELSDKINIINVLLVVIGIVLSLLYILIWKIRQGFSFTANHSILNLNVFKNSDFTAGAVVNVIARAAMCGVPVLLGVILQQIYGFSVLKAGLYFAVIAIAGISAKFLSSYIEKIGVYPTIAYSSFFISLSIALLSYQSFWVTTGYLWVPCFLLGFTMSLLYTSMNSVMYLSLQKNETANASSIGSIIQQFGIGLGVVLAMGGFQLVISQFDTSLSHAFQQICYFLAGLMMFIPVSAILFRSFYKHH